MATTGVMNGTKLRLYADPANGSTYAVIGNSLDVTINFSHSPRETTNQDSAGYATFLEGKRVTTIDFNFLHSEDATQNIVDFYDAWASSTQRAAVTFKVATATTGDTTWTGGGYITSLTLNSGGPEANATCSGSIQVSGALTKGTVS